RVENPEIPQAPRAVTQILGDRPSCRCDLIALGHDIVDFEHQFHPGRRPPRGAGIRHHRPPGGSDTHTAPLQRDVWAGLVTPISDQAETQDAQIEIDGGVEIIRKDLEPQCHLHHPDGGISASRAENLSSHDAAEAAWCSACGGGRYAARFRVGRLPAFLSGAFFAAGFLDRAFLAGSAGPAFCFAVPRRAPRFPPAVFLAASTLARSASLRSITVVPGGASSAKNKVSS